MLSIRHHGVRTGETLALAALLALGAPLAASAANETENVTRTVQVAAGGTVRVRNFSGIVAITGSDRSDVVVSAVRRAPRERLERIALDVQSDGHTVTIEANKRRDESRHDRENVVDTDLTIEVPRQVALDVEVFSSSVTVRGVASAHHRIKTFSGAIDLADLGGQVEAETFSGGIKASPASWQPSDTLTLHTFSGAIGVRVTPQASAAVEFDSFSGDLDSQVPLTFQHKSRHGLSATLNASDGTGQAKLAMHTFSGDAQLYK